MNRKQAAKLEYHNRRLLREVPEERFDMGTWSCGTGACWGGHLPQTFPKDWAINGILRLSTLDDTYGNTVTALRRYFGLSLREVETIVMPNEYRWGNEKIPMDAVVQRVRGIVCGHMHADVLELSDDELKRLALE